MPKLPEKKPAAPIYSPCHSGNVLVYETDTMRVFGGGHSRGANLSAVHLVVDLAYSVAVANPIKYIGESSFLKKIAKNGSTYTKAVDTLSIDWPDFSIPNVHESLFIDLIDAIKEEAKAFVKANDGKKMDVLFCCAGGHGRTGTMLVIAGILLGRLKRDKHCVTELRKIYCSSAVESLSQASLIDSFAGCPVDWVSPKKEGGYQAALFPTSSPGYRGDKTDDKSAKSSDEDDYYIKPWSY